ncbi:MAG: erythromycin esterase family protein [Candidatus Babeliales bacterium]
MNYEQEFTQAIKKAAIPMTHPSMYKQLLTYIGDAQIVLLGEATHGTHEFYELRAEISKRLITEKNFNAIAIEGDWPDAYQINRYTHHEQYTNAADALASFDRFPTWMWGNVPILHLAEWLRNYNQQQSPEMRVNFYGLDLYSLYRSVDTIINYLEKIDPSAAEQARHYYSCFDQYRNDPQDYAYAVYTHIIRDCSQEVMEQLKIMAEQNWQRLAHGTITADAAFNLDQNARVVKNAEYYYRSLFIDEVNNWNVRDSHMADTVNELIKHYQNKGIAKPKIIIWAHNSHIGDARATQMGKHGELNIGQLMKEQFGKKAVNIGFTTYHGTVSAASNWHRPVERKQVRNALPNSYESLFHGTGIPNFLLLLDTQDLVPGHLIERAIGVVYQPQTERMSHYFYANLAEQFDAVIHCDKTTALEPLEKTSLWITGEIPETYPTGL